MRSHRAQKFYPVRYQRGDWGEYPTLAAVESALIEQCVF
jgi:hypothetical protein